MKIYNLIVFFLVAVTVWAAPAKKSAQPYTAGSAKVVGAVESRTPFSGERLFATLDSVGGTGTWMEWDVNGVKDPSLMGVLDPMLKSANKPEMVWVITERSKPLVAVLLPKGAGEVMMFYELAKLDAAPVALAINSVLAPDVVFRDYEQINDSELAHRDRNSLRVQLLKNGFRFTYEKKEDKPLRMEPGYAQKTFTEKKSILRDYEDYFKYEYSLMLRAFVQSTRGIFNWQPWHWYMPEWNAKYMLKREELEAILVKGIFPPLITLFKAKTAVGETVEFKTNGSGYWELLLLRP